VVVADILDQCATIGDLHHAFDRVSWRETCGELADVIAGRKPGRQTADEIIVFDSTGTALEDVAAATLVYERAVKSGMGITASLISSGARPPS
jgi:ornithine cyclodeaminase/alanine dehydrogenase-like protein (mu-crystallin family)